MFLDGTTVMANGAQYGSGIDISNAGNTGMACPTLVFAQNSLFAQNSATEKGAAFSIFNIYLGGFTNVTFDGNFGEHHGAAGLGELAACCPKQPGFKKVHACLHMLNKSHAEAPMGIAAPNGGAVVLAGDGLTAPAGDPFPWRNQFSMTECTFINNKAAYGGAIFVDQLVRLLHPRFCPCCDCSPRALAGGLAG